MKQLTIVRDVENVFYSRHFLIKRTRNKFSVDRTIHHSLFWFSLSTEELADKVKRDKLWDIYLGESDPNVSNEKLIQAEIIRIRHIEKQLAVINQNHRVLQENLVSDSFQFPSQSIFESTRENRFRVRRRSSFDQQIIEQWKRFGEQCRNHEQLPWAIQKHIIRRHFRRRQKELLKEFEQINAYINNSK